MSIIVVQCVHCGARLKGKPEDAGKTKTCPRCGKPVKVPLRPIAGGQAPRPAQQPPPLPQRAARQAPADDAGLSATLPDVPEEPPHEAEAASPPEHFYGGDVQHQPSLVKWVVALVIFLAGTAACIVILSRKGKESEEAGPMITVTAQTLMENRQLYERAINAYKKNSKEEALKLFRDLVAKLEKYPPGYQSGLDQIKVELKAMETGRTAAEIWAEERGETPQQPTAPAPQPQQPAPAVQPDAQPDQEQQPDAEPPPAPDAEPAEQPDAVNDEQ